MKYQELSIYLQSHAAYNEYINSKIRCAALKEKPMIQSKLYPYVRDTRLKVQKQIAVMGVKVAETTNSITSTINRNIGNIIVFMRDPKNLVLRQGVVALSTLVGFHFGNRRRHITKKLFFAALAAAYSGLLCFPEVTDQYIREYCYAVSKALITLNNLWCGSSSIMKKKLPCPSSALPTAKLYITTYNEKCSDREEDRDV